MLRIFSIFVIMSMVQTSAFAKVDPGCYRNNSIQWECAPGCYCVGNATAKTKRWLAGDPKKGCRKRWSKISEFNYQGMYLCPDGFTESAKGADTIEECFFTTKTGVRIYYKKVTCPAGQYLPMNSADCAACRAGYECPGIAEGVYPSQDVNQGLVDPAAPVIAAADLSCQPGHFVNGSVCSKCPPGYYCEGGKSDKTECPDPGLPEHQMNSDEWPKEYYGVDGQDKVRLYNFSYTSWLSGFASKQECSINLYGENDRGFFQHQAIRFDPEKGRYSVGGDLFYTSAKKKYYLTERYMIDAQTYCEYHKNEASKWSMLYRQALPCDLNKYCPGVKETRCAAGDYNESMGLQEPKSVTCARGQYLPAYSEHCELCTGEQICNGGDFKTSYRNQGIYTAFTQAQLLYGPDRQKPSGDDLSNEEKRESICWLQLDPILYKKCVLGTSDNRVINTPPPEQTIPSGDSGNSGDNPRDGATAK